MIFSCFFANIPLVDFHQIFFSAPVIYSLLLLLSLASMTIWLHTLLISRVQVLIPSNFLENIRHVLQTKQWELASTLSEQAQNPFAAILKDGLATRSLGTQMMLDAMQTKAKKVTTPLWQRLSLLNEIALLSPMLGLLGTVLGMFYAFYDMNRSLESINALFDGLGVAVGTTVFGLIVSMMSMFFASILKHRLVKNISLLENEAFHLSCYLFTSSVKEVVEKAMQPHNSSL